MLLRRRSHPPRTRFSDEYPQPVVPDLMHSAVITLQICIPLSCAVQPKSSDPSISLGARSSLYRDNVSVVDRQRILPVLETGVLKGEIARSTSKLTMLRIEGMPRPSCRSHVEQAGGLYKMLPHAHLLIVSSVWVSDSSNTIFRVTFQDNQRLCEVCCSLCHTSSLCCNQLSALPCSA